MGVLENMFSMAYTIIEQQFITQLQALIIKLPFIMHFSYEENFMLIPGLISLWQPHMIDTIIHIIL